MVINLARKNILGFTLIELLVSVVIIGVLAGAGIAAYRRFNDKQRVLAAGKEYLTFLRVAQKKAKAGEKPAGCTTLLGYRIAVLQNDIKAIRSAICSNGLVMDEEINFESDIVYKTAAQIDFLGLAGGVEGATSVTIGNLSETYLYQVDIGASGAIFGSEP